MNTDALIQAIGNHIYDLVGDDNSKVIAYSEVEDNVVACSIFYSKELDGRPSYLSGDSDLVNLIYEFWSRSQQELGEFWAALSYCLVDGDVQLEITYKDKFNFDIGRLERRDDIIQNFFGTTDADYGTF